MFPQLELQKICSPWGDLVIYWYPPPKYTASIPVVLRSLLSSWGRCEPPAGIGQSSGGGPGGEAPGNSQDLVLHDIWKGKNPPFSVSCCVKNYDKVSKIETFWYLKTCISEGLQEFPFLVFSAVCHSVWLTQGKLYLHTIEITQLFSWREWHSVRIKIEYQYFIWGLRALIH